MYETLLPSGENRGQYAQMSPSAAAIKRSPLPSIFIVWTV